MGKKHFNGEFRWAVYGMCVAALFIVLLATWVITRIIDCNWTSWQLPAILAISFLVIVSISGMFSALPEIKKELEKEKTKGEN